MPFPLLVLPPTKSANEGANAAIDSFITRLEYGVITPPWILNRTTANRERIEVAEHDDRASDRFRAPAKRASLRGSHDDDEVGGIQGGLREHDGSMCRHLDLMTLRRRERRRRWLASRVEKAGGARGDVIGQRAVRRTSKDCLGEWASAEISVA
jgi:hypothetical protein